MKKNFDLNKLRYSTAYGLIIPNQQDPYLKELLDSVEEPEIHGDKIWDSSFLIMDYLRHNPLPEAASIMEAGCGWGLLSTYCAKIWDAKVTGVDADQHVFPMLDFHAQLNGVQVNTICSKYQQLTKRTLKQFDTIVGSDICFWDELTPALFTLIERALSSNVRQIIISDPGRSPFHKLVRQCKKAFNAKRIDWSVVDPVEHDGELLIITA